MQETSTMFAKSEGLPSADVRALQALPDGRVYAGTSAGLAVFAEGAWRAVPGFGGRMVYRLGQMANGDIVAVLDEGLFGVNGQLLTAWPKGLSSPLDISCLAQMPCGVAFATPQGLYCLRDGQFVLDAGWERSVPTGVCIRDLTIGPRGQGVAATDVGLFLCDGDEAWSREQPNDSASGSSWALRDVRVATYDARSRLWFGCPQGVGRRERLNWTLYSGADGLPFTDFTCVDSGPEGEVWFGTRIGAVGFDGHHWVYRQGQRWLPDDAVRDIAVGPEGQVWIATAAGIALIERTAMTATEKAAFYESEIDKRSRRTPFEYVSGVGLAQPGDTSQWQQHDTDNDGQYTGLYGAAECFAYAATGDAEAKRRAKQAFEALRFLGEVTQGGPHPAPPGFIARAILPTDGRDPNAHDTAEHDRERRKHDALWKVMDPRWPVSADGKWYWKTDASSDELDGHYFFNGLYYDHVADTEEERERVREVVRGTTDHLMEHNYRLVDWDGEPTRWANFSPDSLNHDPNWWPERGLNSLSVLTYLLVAEHVTGDTKYGEASRELIEKHGYAMNGMYPKVQRGPGSYVQFDDEMAFMNYYSLLKYERDPKVREMYALSCFRYWEIKEPEHGSFCDLAYAASCQGLSVTTPWGTQDVSAPAHCVENAADTLRRYPLDLVCWSFRNSHRTDIVPLPAYAREPGEAEGKGHLVSGETIPIDERIMTLWADDAWVLDTNGGGADLATGSPFLLAYYLGLYHGLLDENLSPCGR